MARITSSLFAIIYLKNERTEDIARLASLCRYAQAETALRVAHDWVSIAEQNLTETKIAHSSFIILDDFEFEILSPTQKRRRHDFRFD